MVATYMALEGQRKPPDESFRRLETACPELSLTLSLCILYTVLILGARCSKPRGSPRT